MLHTEYISLVASILFFLSILASKASSKLGVPALLLFLVIGMLAGSEGIGGIHFDNPHIAQFVGSIALVFILFSGGLDTQWQSIRHVLVNGLLLSTFGVIMSALLLGWAAHYLLHFTWLESLLLGSIVASTDAATVFAIFRARSVKITEKLKHLIEFESASNDPMAIILTIGFIRFLTLPHTSLLPLLGMFFMQMILGTVFGLALGYSIFWMIQRINLEYEGLYPVFTIASALFIYSMTALLGGNGFLSVYLAGLVLGNQAFARKKELISFHNGLTWLMQIGMFLTLGLLVFPSTLLQVAGVDILVAAFLMFVARPVSVFALTSFSSQLQFKEKLLVSWVGLRGAVPIILATFPLVAGIAKAEVIFNLVFFIVLTSMFIQGGSLSLVAKYLKLEA
ncbi:MAG TPA: potassium/proton antiporter [Coxiellaceae bacterium]|nr:potassium/proton antiporter [Coxiellaceae bacterium]